MNEILVGILLYAAFLYAIYKLCDDYLKREQAVTTVFVAPAATPATETQGSEEK